MPAIELPIRITGRTGAAGPAGLAEGAGTRGFTDPPGRAQSAGTDSIKRCNRSVFDATSVPRPADWVRPCPARSGASSRYRPVSSGAIADQFTAEPPSPCTQTITGPPAGPPKSREWTGPRRSTHRDLPPSPGSAAMAGITVLVGGQA